MCSEFGMLITDVERERVNEGLNYEILLFKLKFEKSINLVKLLFLKREFNSFFNERPKSYRFSCMYQSLNFLSTVRTKNKETQKPKFKHVNNNNKYFDIPYISYNILK